MKKKVVKKTATSRAWAELNKFLMSVEDEKVCQKLLQKEQQGLARKQFILRIHSRLSRLRGAHEREKLLG